MTIGIIDYGMGNLRSVQKGFEKTGIEAAVISTPRQVHDARALVLPGVGAFKKCFENLEALKLTGPICASIQAGKPFLGICLGLQILFTESEEFGHTPGLDVIKGRVVRFPGNMTDSTGQHDPVLLKIPHMGWNAVAAKKENPYLRSIPDGSYFYFVHSYYVAPDETDVVATTSTYGIEFVSSIYKDNVFACQFHPEKSQTIGLQMLKNFGHLAKG